MTIWHPSSNYPPADCTNALWEWLISTDSLTARLRQFSNHHISMQLLHAGWGNALAEEQELLAQFSQQNAQRFWLREIMHVYQQQAWIWGRVIIPEKILQKTGLDGQSSQPIGDILFNDPQTIRTQLSVARLPASHFYYGKISAYLQNTAEAQQEWHKATPYAMGDRKGEQRAALPLHSEHRLRRAQDQNNNHSHSCEQQEWLWARRSILWFQQQPLLVAEVFLPDCFKYR